MTSSRPIAIWLLEHGGLDTVIAGDLLEELARGRSTIWYWRQLLMAIGIGNWNTIRQHRVLALRALATGCAMEWALVYAWDHWVPDITPFTIAQWTLQMSTALLTQTLVGWVIARTHRAQQAPMVLLFLLCFEVYYFVRVVSWITTLVKYTIPAPTFLAYTAMFTLTALMIAIGILLGGIVAPFKRAQTAHEDAKPGLQ
jgi:hypothetical protein